jgi:hypothetical protein
MRKEDNHECRIGKDLGGVRDVFQGTILEATKTSVSRMSNPAENKTPYIPNKI